MISKNSATKRFNSTEAQVAKLLKMQDELNTYIHPEWKTQGFDWYEAIVDECCELKGHLGWKWWKKDYKVGLTDNNRKQVQLEVIDILHFMLSGLIENQYTPEEIVTIFNGSMVPTNYTLANAVDRMRFMACDGYYAAVQWAWAAQLTDLTEQEILETYTQKYVLNKFRQDHGYKDGSYVKEWLLPISEHNGAPEFKEDNEVLSHVVNQFTLGGRDTTDEQLLYNTLKFYYNYRLN